MAKGAAGDYRLPTPLAHFNGITARLLDTGAAGPNHHCSGMANNELPALGHRLAPKPAVSCGLYSSTRASLALAFRISYGGGEELRVFLPDWGETPAHDAKNLPR